MTSSSENVRQEKLRALATLDSGRESPGNTGLAVEWPSPQGPWRESDPTLVFIREGNWKAIPTVWRISVVSTKQRRRQPLSVRLSCF